MGVVIRSSHQNQRRSAEHSDVGNDEGRDVDSDVDDLGTDVGADDRPAPDRPASHRTGAAGGLSGSGPTAAAPPAERAVTAGLLVALAVPFVVAVVQLRHPLWHANLDLALTELRVRDVTSTRPPLVGLSGRIEGLGQSGSHPGPLSFWLLAPAYRLFGATSWALQASTAALNLGAVCAAVWIGHRRGGRVGALAVATGMAFLLQAYGAERWTQAWNPYLPLMWWPVLLLAVWSVLCDDPPLVPVVAVVGTLCIQTHVSYLGLVGVLGLVALWPLVGAVRRRDADPGRLRATLFWWAVGGLACVVLWAPPVAQEVRNDPGNLSILWAQFGDASEPALGFGQALEIWLGRLDVVALGTGEGTVHAVWADGAALIAVWLLSAAVAWSRARRDLVLLHVVTGVALLAGFVSVTRIQGQPFPYLTLWGWGTAALAVAAVAWTILDVGATLRPGRAAALRRGGAAVLTALGAIAIALATVDAATVDPPQPGQAAIHSQLLPDVVTALQADGAPGGGALGHYLVRSDDPVSAGLNSYTLLLELERHGIAAGVDPTFEVSVRTFRVVRPENATAVLTYAVGPAVDRWRAVPDAVEIASASPSADDLATFDRLGDQVVDDLRQADLDDLVDAAELDDGSLLALADDERVPEDTVDLIEDMVALGGPTAIFVSPVVPWP